MTNFAEYGLILCPAIDSYENRTSDYKQLLKKSVNNIITFLSTKNIKPLMFITDQVANILSPDGVYWAQTITDEDLRFAVANCDNIQAVYPNAINYPDFYEAIDVLYPPMEDESDKTAMFEYMCKRVSKLEKALIKRQKVIFNIQTQNNASYNVKPVDGESVILCNVHNGSFIPTTYMGSMQENPIVILDYPLANRPIFEWRF